MQHGGPEGFTAMCRGHAPASSRECSGGSAGRVRRRWTPSAGSGQGYYNALAELAHKTTLPQALGAPGTISLLARQPVEVQAFLTLPLISHTTQGSTTSTVTGVLRQHRLLRADSAQDAVQLDSLLAQLLAAPALLACTVQYARHFADWALGRTGAQGEVYLGDVGPLTNPWWLSYCKAVSAF